MSVSFNNQGHPVRSHSNDSSLGSKRENFRLGIRKQNLDRIIATKRKEYFGEMPTTDSRSQRFVQDGNDQVVLVGGRSAVMANDAVERDEVRQARNASDQRGQVRNQRQQVGNMNVEGFQGDRMNSQINPIQPSVVNPFLNAVVNSSVNPSVNTMMNPSVNRSVSPSANLFANTSLSPSVNRSVSPSVNPFLSTSLSPPVNLFRNTVVNPVVNNNWPPSRPPLPSANLNPQSSFHDRSPALNIHNISQPPQLMQPQAPLIQSQLLYPQPQLIFQPIQLQPSFIQPIIQPQLQPALNPIQGLNSSMNQLDFTFNVIQNNSFNMGQVSNSTIIFSPSRPGNQSFSQFLNQLSPPRQQVAVFNEWNGPNSGQRNSPQQFSPSYQVVGNILSNERILNQPDLVNPYIEYIQERVQQIEQQNKAELLKPDEQLHPSNRYQFSQHLQQDHMDNRNQPIKPKITPYVMPFKKQKPKQEVRGPLKVEFKQEIGRVEKKEQSKIGKIDEKPKQDKIEEKKQNQEQKRESKKNPTAELLKQHNYNPQSNSTKPKTTSKSQTFQNLKWQSPIQIQNKKFLNSIIQRSNLSTQLRFNLLKTLQYGYQIIKHHGDFVVFNYILGKGTFGSVYMGRNFRTNEKVAVKIIKFKKEKHLLEVKFLKEINHKNIVTLHDYLIEEKEHECYLFLQYCKENLRQCLQKLNKPYNRQISLVQTKLKYAQQLIEGMNQLNEKGFIHRDLKFENILIKDNQIVKICDFGLCRKVNKKLQVDSVRCGTPYTMPPEIYFHPKNKDPTYTEKADIFSLAVLLHQLLYNFHPFDYEELHLKNLSRIQQQKTHKMSKRFTEEYGLKVQWINEIIEGGLKNVEERMSWEDVMKVFGKRLGKEVVEEKKDKQAEVKRNFIKKQVSSSVIISNKEDKKEIKKPVIKSDQKPVIQTKLLNINQKKIEFNKVQPNEQKKNFEANQPNNPQNSYPSNRLQVFQQKHADFIEEAKRIFSKQGMIKEKQQQQNNLLLKGNKNVVQRKEEILQVSHLQNLRNLRELKPRISDKEAKPLSDLKTQVAVEGQISQVSNNTIAEDSIKNGQISVRKLFILLLLLAMIILGVQIMFVDKEPTILQAEMKTPVQSV